MWWNLMWFSIFLYFGSVISDEFVLKDSGIDFDSYFGNADIWGWCGGDGCGEDIDFDDSFGTSFCRMSCSHENIN